MAFVLFVLAGVAALIAALVGAGAIDTTTDWLQPACLGWLAVCFIAFGLAVGSPRPRV